MAASGNYIVESRKYKRCSKCGKRHLATLKHFGKHKGRKDGLQNQCKICVRKKQREYNKSESGRASQYKLEERT